METLFTSNPGLRSRVPHSVHFADYSAEEVAEITVRIIAKSWAVDTVRLAALVAAAYRSLPESEQANGRSARIFAEQL